MFAFGTCFNLIPMTFKQIYLPIDGTIKCTPSPGESEAGSNDSEGVDNTHQVSRTVASPSDAVQCHNQSCSLFYLIGLNLLQEIQSAYPTPRQQWIGKEQSAISVKYSIVEWCCDVKR